MSLITNFTYADMKIDFVIPWVDGADKEWQRQKSEFTGQPINENDVRYRDWGIIKYWFRSVEKYAPWVNKIYFVTCGQVPDWLNVKHEKLCIVNHRDYIPEQYLPTFSANPIELNLHRITGLSEYFVYFNDDMIINKEVFCSDFYKEGLPRLSAILNEFIPTRINDSFLHLLCNDIAFMNTYFNKKKVIKRNPQKWFSLEYGKHLWKNIYYFLHASSFSMLQNFHMPSPMLKSTFKKVWELEPDLLHNTSLNRIRSHRDVNQYIMSYYNIGTGHFMPQNPNVGKYYEIREDNHLLFEDILQQHHKFICINDNENIEDIMAIKENIISLFERKFPNKSSFEK